MKKSSAKKVAKQLNCFQSFQLNPEKQQKLKGGYIGTQDILMPKS